MKKIILGMSIFSIALVALAFYSSHVFADDKPNHGGDNNNNSNNDDKNNKNPNFNADSQLTKGMCGSNLGDPIINITQKVQNDVDSGFGHPTYWAFDYYTRHIKVWPTTTNTYCAVVTYDGNFYAVPGQGQPGDPSGTLINSNMSQPINGDFNGGRRATITGTLLATSLWPTNGSVGTTNYKCDLSQTCPGYVSWPDKYFNPGYTNSDQWWGWQYKGGSHGTWVNECVNNATDTVPGNNPACLGSSGNIQ